MKPLHILAILLAIAIPFALAGPIDFDFPDFPNFPPPDWNFFISIDADGDGTCAGVLPPDESPAAHCTTPVHTQGYEDCDDNNPAQGAAPEGGSCGIDADGDGRCLGAFPDSPDPYCSQYQDCDDNDPLNEIQPNLEVCNGADDDCDDIPDENPGTLCLQANMTCKQGACDCRDGYANCDNDISNGCEAILDDDPLNCGYCGRPCVTAHATTECGNPVDGTCTISSCETNYYDIDGLYLNGCEYACTPTSNSTDLEICDNDDDDCDGEVDEGCDDDKDAFCDEDAQVLYSANGVSSSIGVCWKSQGEPGLHPGDDCNDAVEEDTPVGSLQNPGRNENNLATCTDGIDNDCNDLIDEEDAKCNFIFICKSEQFDFSNRACIDGTWCIGSYVEGFPRCDYQTSQDEIGTHGYYVFACTSDNCTFYYNDTFQILPTACVPGTEDELCGNYRDDDCNGLADENCLEHCEGMLATECVPIETEQNVTDDQVTANGTAPHCSNNVQDEGESGVDCGGSAVECPRRCPLGESCDIDGDCASGLSCINGFCGGICTQDCEEGDPCATDPACNSESCGAENTCIAPTCSDGINNGDETGVDCGGSCVAEDKPCPTGSPCEENSDCENQDCIPSGSGSHCGGVCTSDCPVDYPCEIDPQCASLNCEENLCQEADPTNEDQDGTETDDDCGGNNIACEDGQGCQNHGDCVNELCRNGFCGEEGCIEGCAPAGAPCTNPSDCLSRVCLPNGFCAEASCSDGIFNGDETSVDCGGSCDNCVDGLFCKDHTDCASGSCINSYCGGVCTSDCPPGFPCSNDAECASNVCNGNVCFAPSPHDDVENNGETAVDCGGPNAPPCTDGHRCREDTDCVQEDCTDGYCGGICTSQCPRDYPCYTDSICESGKCGADMYCEPATNNDGEKNGDETGIDCGGTSGQLCEYGSGCEDNYDCLDTNCVLGYCGGICLEECETGAPCENNDDCLSGMCTNNICESGNHEDGIKNAGETGVDCGGTSGTPCNEGEGCAVESDCVSEFPCENGFCGGVCLEDCESGAPCETSDACDSGVCNTGACADATCDDGQRNGAEADVDCGRECDVPCASGSACNSVFDCTSGTACIQGYCGGYVAGSKGATGAPCTASGECESKVCGDTGTCAAPTCGDGELNGGESSIDCGGSCVNKCLEGAPCLADADCVDGSCLGGFCGGIVRPQDDRTPELAPGFSPLSQQYQQEAPQSAAPVTDLSSQGANFDEEFLTDETESTFSWFLVTLVAMIILGLASYMGYKYYHKPVKPSMLQTPLPPKTQTAVAKSRSFQDALSKHKALSAVKDQRKQLGKSFASSPATKKALPVTKTPSTPQNEGLDELESILEEKPKKVGKAEKTVVKKSDNDYMDLEEMEKEKPKKSKKKGDDDVFDKL